MTYFITTHVDGDEWVAALFSAQSAYLPDAAFDWWYAFASAHVAQLYRNYSA